MSDRNTAEIVELPVNEIGPGPLVRTDRVDDAHAELLRPMLDLVPPIVVRETGKGWSLIDGQHRLSAAKKEWRKTIRAVVVALDDAEALEAAIKANTGHGKALSLAERRNAATMLLGSTDWSDRRIADCCGLVRATVGKMRPTPAGGQNEPPATRTGSDGKSYPVSNSPAVLRKWEREAAEAEALANQPVRTPEEQRAHEADVFAAARARTQAELDAKTLGQEGGVPATSPPAPTPPGSVASPADLVSGEGTAHQPLAADSPSDRSGIPAPVNDSDAARSGPPSDLAGERWLTQTILHDPEQPDVMGNCWQTVIACILGLPLDEVPHFVQDHESMSGVEEATRAWAGVRGFDLIDVSAGEVHDTTALTMLYGRSPRGVAHVVVGRGAEVIHDPHPSRDGLASVGGAFVFAALDPARFDQAIKEQAE